MVDPGTEQEPLTGLESDLLDCFPILLSQVLYLYWMIYVPY